jgi:uncharacterized glyoxalase superfamily protein PhnB
MTPSKPPAKPSTITSYLTPRDAGEAIAFYQGAFGAEERVRIPTPDGTRVMHAELQIGDSILMLSDPIERAGGPPVGFYIHLTVTDADEVFEQAQRAGAKVLVALHDAFWGARYGQLVDPFGYTWAISAHQRDVPEGEAAGKASAWYTEFEQERSRRSR